MFIEKMKETMNSEFNYSVTENGALGYRTSGKNLLDLNFAVASLRSASEEEIIRKFNLAFYEDKLLAMKWLFYARDVREGLGERRLFRVIISSLAQSNPEIILPLIKLIDEYGRWDDMLCLLDNENTYQTVINKIKRQLAADSFAMKGDEPITLLAKWLPSPAASSAKTKAYAKKVYAGLGMTERQYRKTLSKLRKYIDVVEVKISANKWDEIDYETVPSCANLKYRNAFLRHDEQRRREFLQKVSVGEANINASVLYPHDIVHKYTDGGMFRRYILNSVDDSIEALWKALPDNVCKNDNTIVVADGSGSMRVTVENTGVTALDVANALAIYFAEHASGEFKDKYITFSLRPQFVDFSRCNSLYEKLKVALLYNEVANTNIEAVFDLILNTAVKNKMSQNDMPKNILIISDMEFDNACGFFRYKPSSGLFDIIAQKYEAAGYKIPRLIFWNVNSRTGTIPVKQNELGVALVSGFSTNICKMILSGETDPYKCLLEVLNSDRYKPVEYALSGVI